MYNKATGQPIFVSKHFRRSPADTLKSRQHKNAEQLAKPVESSKKRQQQLKGQSAVAIYILHLSNAPGDDKNK